MWPIFTRPLDRLAIRTACAGMKLVEGPPQAEAASELLADPGFLNGPVLVPELQWEGPRQFRFQSPVTGPWPENNVVHGKWLPYGRDWQRRPTVVLVHGWNGERQYRWQFPWLAWRLRWGGMNTAMVQLPYHGQRKPREPGAIRNFISHDLLRMVEATGQSVAEIRALMAWLRSQGVPAVGIWGISLGAWLSGLVASHEPQTNWAVLMSPVVRLEQAIAELRFCEPIRRSLAQTPVSVTALNLARHSLAIRAEQVLLIECIYDLFAPIVTIEELWEAWGHPAIWRVAQGHISILLSWWMMERTVRWIQAQGRSCLVKRI